MHYKWLCFKQKISRDALQSQRFYNSIFNFLTSVSFTGVSLYELNENWVNLFLFMMYWKNMFSRHTAIKYSTAVLGKECRTPDVENCILNILPSLFRNAICSFSGLLSLFYESIIKNINKIKSKKNLKIQRYLWVLNFLCFLTPPFSHF